MTGPFTERCSTCQGHGCPDCKGWGWKVSVALEALARDE